MYFTYIDWVKERFTKKQKAEINMANNEYNRAIETARLSGIDEDTFLSVVFSYSEKGVNLRRKYFEETVRRLNQE